MTVQRVIDVAVVSDAYRNPGEVLDQTFEIIRERLDRGVLCRCTFIDLRQRRRYRRVLGGSRGHHR